MTTRLNLPPASVVGVDDHGARRGTPSHPFDEESVGGVPVAVTTTDRAVDWLQDWSLERRGGIDVRLVNAYSVVTMQPATGVPPRGSHSGISLPDGAPVAAALRLLRGRREAGRVRGPSFFLDAMERSAGSGVREYFLGTTEETLHQLQDSVTSRWPEVVLAGSWAPPFQEQIDDAFVRACEAHIEATGADRVWIALGTPKQDRLAARLADVLQVPCVGIGAAFDFVAGTKREAPVLVQRLGIEWLYCLVTEPRRLWRRYLIGNLQFLWLVARDGR